MKSGVFSGSSEENLADYFVIQIEIVGMRNVQFIHRAIKQQFAIHRFPHSAHSFFSPGGQETIQQTPALQKLCRVWLEMIAAGGINRTIFAFDKNDV